MRKSQIAWPVWIMDVVQLVVFARGQKMRILHNQCENGKRYCWENNEIVC